MSVQNGEEPSAPVLMTCGELIHQEDQYIREYAAHYNIPTDLKRGDMLERICALHTGSGPAIPVLQHFTFERGEDNRIRITGRSDPAGPPVQPPNNSRRRSDSPPTRRLLRRNAQIIYLEEPTVPEPIPGPIPEPAPQMVKSPKVPAAPTSIIPEELYPTKRFPTPSDTYSPSPSREPSPIPRSPRSEASGILPKPRMEFVYPPKPRGHARHRPGEDESADNEDENLRGFSPGPPWLEKMLVDLELGRKDLVADLEEMKEEAQSALYEVTRLRILLDREQKATKHLVDWMRSVMGDEMVDAIIAEGKQAAEERSSEEESDEEGDEEGDDQEEGEERERDGERHESGDDDGHHEGDEHAADGYKKLEQSSSKRDSSKEEPENAVDDSTPGFLDREFAGRYLDSIFPSPPRLKRSFETINEVDEEEDADDENSPRRPVAGPSHKRLRTSPSPPKSPMSAPPIATLEDAGTSSPSRKRGRHDDDEESEQEVERSIRVSVGLEGSYESLPRSANKRFRSDVDGTATEATDAAATSNPELAVVRHASLERSSSEPSTSDDGGSVVDTSDEEGTHLVPFQEYLAIEDDDDDDDSYIPLDDDDEHDTLQFDVAEDMIVIALNASSDEDSEDGHSNSEHKPQQSLHFLIDEEGKGSWMLNAPRSRSPSLDIEDYVKYVEELEDEPPSHEYRAIDDPSQVGPPRILGFCRPLKRTRERLRPTSEGGVEVYKYDEGPEYEARLAKDAEVFAEWKKFEPESSGHRTRQSSRETKKTVL